MSNNTTTIEAIRRVDALRKQLREAEAHLKAEIAAFSRRNNYGYNLRECHVRSQLEHEMQKEKAA